jgi:transcriptional regulator with XRE-family HTH domain
MDKKIIGKRLRALRGDKTIRQVAEDVGIACSTLAMYEAGQRTPKDGVKLLLANYYGTSVEELFFAS